MQKPRDILEYRIDFKNIGVDTIQKLLIADIIPTHTTLLENQYSGHDIKIEIISPAGTDTFYGDIGGSGVELDSSGTLKVDVFKIAKPSYTVLEPGVEGRLYYRVKIECPTD